MKIVLHFRMDIQEKLKQFFTKEMVVDLLTKYELYYQISLGYFVYDTLQDIEDTYSKLKELDLKPQPNVYLSNIFEVVLQHGIYESEDANPEYQIRARASLHALKDFLNNDNELINVNSYAEQKTKDILEDKIFTTTMKAEFESEYSAVFEYYETIVTDDILESFHKNLASS